MAKLCQQDGKHKYKKNSMAINLLEDKDLDNHNRHYYIVEAEPGHLLA